MIFIMEISEAKVQYNTFSVFYQTNMFWVLEDVKNAVRRLSSPVALNPSHFLD
jgi:hypothetical protein